MQSWASRRKAIVKKVRAFPKLIEQEKSFETQPPSVFVFCDSNTGMPQFRSEAARDVVARSSRSATMAKRMLASGPAAGTKREADAVCIAVDEMRMILPPVS